MIKLTKAAECGAGSKSFFISWRLPGRWLILGYYYIIKQLPVVIDLPRHEKTITLPFIYYRLIINPARAGHHFGKKTG
jgi:hypothetical protein